MTGHPTHEEHHPDRQQYIRDQIRKLVLMKETGPKSAAWHRARVGTIWRLHQQLASVQQRSDDADER